MDGQSVNEEIKALEHRITTLEADNLLLKTQLKEILEALHDAQAQ